MPAPISPDEFAKQIRSTDAGGLAREYVLADAVHAFGTAEAYESYRSKVKLHLPQAEYIAIVGSGNWRFSLNPTKLLSEFRPDSDIDVAVVSSALYHETWESMRQLHRDRWHTLDEKTRCRLRRHGEDVYAGFACPSWLPIPGHPLRYAFKSLLSKLSGPEVGYREVRMFYYKNETEMIDYYKRGFIKARWEIRA